MWRTEGGYRGRRNGKRCSFRPTGLRAIKRRENGGKRRRRVSEIGRNFSFYSPVYIQERWRDNFLFFSSNMANGGDHYHNNSILRPLGGKGRRERNTLYYYSQFRFYDLLSVGVLYLLFFSSKKKKVSLRAWKCAKLWGKRGGGREGRKKIEQLLKGSFRSNYWLLFRLYYSGRSSSLGSYLPRRDSHERLCLENGKKALSTQRSSFSSPALFLLCQPFFLPGVSPPEIISFSWNETGKWALQRFRRNKLPVTGKHGARVRGRP